MSNWDDELNLIATRLLNGQDKDKQRVIQRLEVYRKILRDGEIDFKDNQSAHVDLLNIGLVVKRKNNLKIANPIYRTKFDEKWIDQQLNQIKGVTISHEKKTKEKTPIITAESKVMNKQSRNNSNNSQNQGNTSNQTSNLMNQKIHDIKKWFIDNFIILVFGQIFSVIYTRLFPNNLPLWVEISLILIYGLILSFLMFAVFEILKHRKTWINYIESNKKGIIIVILFIAFLIVPIYIFRKNIEVGTINQDAKRATDTFKSKQLEGLSLAIKSGKKLEQILNSNPKITEYPTIEPIYTLHKTLNKIYESNQLKANQEVRAILFNPQGNKIAFTENKSLKIYDFKTKKDRKESFNHVITSFSFSEDGTLIAVGLKNGDVKILNELSLNIIDSESLNTEISSISFSKDKSKLLTTGKNGDVRLWQISRGEFISDKPLFQEEDLQRHKHILSASFSPDGRYIATAGEIGSNGNDEKIKLWDSQSGEYIRSIATNHRRIESISFSRDGKYIATAENTAENTAGNDVVRIWNTQDNTTDKDNLIPEMEAYGVKKVSFSQWKNLELIAAVGTDGIVRVWQFSHDNSSQKPKSELLTKLNGHTDEILTLAFTRKEPYYLATAGKDSKIRIWKFLPQRQILVNQSENMGELKSIHVGLSRQELRLVTLQKDGKAKIWDLNTKIENPNNADLDLQNVAKVTLSGDNKLLAVIKKDGTGKFYNLSGRPYTNKKAFKTPQKEVASFNSKKQVLATAGKDGKIYFWNILQGQNQDEYLDVAFDEIKSLKYSSDDKFVAVRTINNELKVFSLSSKGDWNKINTDDIGKVTNFNFASKEGRIYIVAGTLNGKLLLGELIENEIKKIDIKLWENRVHSHKIEAVISSPDGDYIASFDANDEGEGKAKFWNLSIDKNTHQVKEINLDWRDQTPSKITCLTFSPSYKFGQLIAGGDSNGKIHIWNMKGQKIAEFEPEGNQGQQSKIKVTHITFSPKGDKVDNFIIAAYENGIVRSWQVAELDHLLEEGCKWLENYFYNHDGKNELGC